MNYPYRLALACLLAACSGCTGLKTAAPKPPMAGDVHDWRWVQGAVFVPTNCVNEAQQWDEYDPVINDRELHYASIYGINVVRVYLHYYVYLKKKAALLDAIGDFLERANKYGIRTEFVFFDDCWNQPPDELLSADYKYPAPLKGVHNSQWLVSPGEEARTHYELHRAGLKAYVQDIVNAHKADARVVFWEIYNEPNKSAATIRLERDAMRWIKETGTVIPVTATGREFSGDPFSDFPSWHQYGGYALSGDARSLCTECMNREGQSVPGVVDHFRGKVGYIMWEFGIGRDNCRFAWGENREKPRQDETPTPFHGIVYPDGHPWSVADARALLGAEKFSRTPFFAVDYYSDASFSKLAKTSVTPLIDYDLGDEVGTGSPDASAGVPKDNFSVQYKGFVRAPTDGDYTFFVDSDGQAEIRVDGRALVTKGEAGRGVARGSMGLEANRSYSVIVRYAHAAGMVNLHVSWSGPTFEKRTLEPSTHAEGP